MTEETMVTCWLSQRNKANMPRQKKDNKAVNENLFTQKQ